MYIYILSYVISYIYTYYTLYIYVHLYHNILSYYIYIYNIYSYNTYKGFLNPLLSVPPTKYNIHGFYMNFFAYILHQNHPQNPRNDTQSLPEPSRLQHLGWLVGSQSWTVDKTYYNIIL